MSKSGRFIPALRCFLIVSLGVVWAGCAGSHSSPPPRDLRLNDLYSTPLAAEFTPHREVIVSLVEIPPNFTMDRHWHPGEEFHYYMDGDVTILIDGEESISGTPGTVGHVPFRKMHTAVTGPRGARVLVFRVHTEGEPGRYLERDGTGPR